VVKQKPAISYSWSVLSPWHGRFLRLQAPMIPEENVHVLPNGYEPSLYPRELAQKDRMDPRFIYSSSPDRGLIHLLDAWPKIKREIPGATLSVGYGADNWCAMNLPSHFAQGDIAARILEGLKQEGITSEGLMGQRDLSSLQLKSQLCLYPANTMQATETGCISLIESSAAGLPAITTNCDCLGDEFTGVHEILPLPIEVTEYADRVIEFSKDPKRRKKIREQGFEFVKGRSWRDLSKRWIDLFHTLQR
jgi:glycosyltransferase involved in cell wall biosynthesis